MKRFLMICPLLAGILWGCIGIFVRGLNSFDLKALDLVSIRAGITSAFLFVFLMVFKRSLLKIRLKDIWCFLGTGLASIVFFNFCYFTTIVETSLALACVLMYTSPIFVMVLSFFLFKEKMTRRKVISVILTFIGCLLVTGVIGSGSVLSPKGLLIGLGSGLGYALYSIFSRFALNRGYHSLTITFYTFLFAFISCLFLTDNIRIVRIMASSPASLAYALVFGIAGTAVAYILYTLGMTAMDNSLAAVIVAIEPVTATLVGLIFYGESLTLLTFLGIVAVIAGIILSSSPAKPKAA